MKNTGQTTALIKTKTLVSIFLEGWKLEISRDVISTKTTEEILQTTRWDKNID